MDKFNEDFLHNNFYGNGKNGYDFNTTFNDFKWFYS
jgi:hypothetical protein